MTAQTKRSPEGTHTRTEDYVVPLDPDAEARLLGCAMASVQGYEAALAEGVEPQDFDVPRYHAAWLQLTYLYKAGAQVSSALVAQPLLTAFPPDRDYEGIAKELADLQAKADLPMAPRHAATVSVYAERRRLLLNTLGFGHQVELADADTTGNELLVNATRQLADALSTQRNSVRGIGQVYDEMLAELTNPKPPTATGWTVLDEAWAGGMYPRRLYAIAARMKVGKTTFLFSLASQAAEQGARVAYIALEMGAVDLLRRHLARHTPLKMPELLSGQSDRLPDGDVARIIADHRQEWADKDFAFYDRRGLDTDGLRGLLARLGSCGYDGIVLDYWQLVRGGTHDRDANRAEELRRSADVLAEMAAHHNCWILTAAQLNREQKLRDSDGLLMSCDWLAHLEECEDDGGEFPGYYLAVKASRYTPTEDIGGVKQPSLEMVTNAGPHFRPAMARQSWFSRIAHSYNPGDD